jgi:metal-responsive CopG/Arc/MetJ family transcriptional regulator
MSENEKVFLTIQIDKQLRETFKKVVKANDEDVSKVIRRLIRKYINENRQGTLQ